ncbi:hypothetical protein PHLCEN_2v9997 [Hermanssonia centrifuga]|uniref:Uncharacterized protein n=1 Tax=Hermanssonia centrifuga TaxID=98765 RepID=A0A2R6NP75_9APHY|nr:hypothetical protein PHLCEN_2v9997 [Hermanssonia centrifuga]
MSLSDGTICMTYKGVWLALSLALIYWEDSAEEQQPNLTKTTTYIGATCHE